MAYALASQLYGFTSARKMASCLINTGDKYRLYNKGAAEWVIRRCKYLMYDGQKVEVTEEVVKHMTEVVEGMAKRGLRCICLAYRDYELNDPSRWVG